jgi:predicted deacylase
VFGAELLYRGAPFPGSLSTEAEKLGIPVVVTEFGGGQARTEHFIEKGKRGILNVMRHLGMIGGELERPAAQSIATELATLRPHEGGLLQSEVTADQLGQTVPRGSLLGTIRHPATFEVLERIEAPFEPSILVLVREAITRVDPGDYGYMVANGATAEAVERT